MSQATARLGGHLVADALVSQGVSLAFGVPGESYLSVLDGLYRHADFRFIVTRHEGGAAFMADAYAKLTGKPGVCLVTRGPGATNAAIGIHTAQQDSTPLVLLVGQVGQDVVEREAFQEIDYRRMFGSMAKWVAQIDQAERVPEMLAHAFQLATSGRPGPVVLALPEDMLAASTDVADAHPHQPLQASPSAAQLAQLTRLLEAARQPFVIVGGSGWSHQACADLRLFAESWQLPVACAFRFQDLFDNQHPLYAGDVGIGINPRLAERLRQADLVLCLGARLGEMTSSGYSLFDIPIPRQQLVHVHAGVEELGRVYQATLMINAGMAEMTAALRLIPCRHAGYAAVAAEARADFEAWQGIPPIYLGRQARLDLWQVVMEARRQLPADTLVCNGAGNFASWAHRFWRYGSQEQARCQLAPTSGAMGYGLPAGVMASIVAPERTVLVFAGDGDFLMNGQELATALQYGGAPIVLLFNNSQYGTIRMHQEKHFPGRVYGTQLHNPDFARYAESFGALGLVVETTAQFGPALSQALVHRRQTGKPALIELRMDTADLAPGLRLAG
ncbi:thiamine pyrophosphate protein [Chitinimonas prasina]|uniref:Thiamine pyrophosphate protein n=1 Tax=Chitinimonas prasina TaxID=1434937 RepID=A0ABQ5YAS1_9NEIS|nr:thiamine pyrophosphate-binding protein [Chitinimonas prasina]GLR12045.1 thiamine pyrophosphate protein [Chitinimonas prasina]